MSMPVIFVCLLDEGVDVWRPVDAEIVAPDWYRILSENENPDDEHWQFGIGDVVRCERRRLPDGECLVAVARKNEHSQGDE
jgi:hypothetical protein